MFVASTCYLCWEPSLLASFVSAEVNQVREATGHNIAINFGAPKLRCSVSSAYCAN